MPVFPDTREPGFERQFTPPVPFTAKDAGMASARLSVLRLDRLNQG